MAAADDGGLAAAGVGCQERDVDVVLAGQTPFAELFEEPSAPLLDGAAGCLVDCDDATRLARLRERVAVDPWRQTTPYTLDDYLPWAALMRRHVRDPQHGLHVIRENAWPEMRRARLAGTDRARRTLARPFDRHHVCLAAGERRRPRRVDRARARAPRLTRHRFATV